MEYLEDDKLEENNYNLANYDLVFLQHLRQEQRDNYRAIFQAAKRDNPSLRIIDISGYNEEMFRDLPGLVEHDPQLRAYYGSSKENLRRLLVYALVTYMGHPLRIQPPEDVQFQPFYHPDGGGFEEVGDFLKEAKQRGWDVENAPRALVVAHTTHLVFQQPKVVDAIIRAFEKRRILAVALLDTAEGYGADGYEQRALEYHPDAVVHTCHSRDSVAFRENLGAPHLHSIFFRVQSIEQWRNSLTGLAPNEMAFHIVGQELLGAIEPQIGAGTLVGGGSDEAFTPIPERIDHLVDRATSWIRLARKKNTEKRIAFIYYDREMGKAELMRGSATGMFMNAPRSLVKILKRMKLDGYTLDPTPEDEDELIDWMVDRGRQIGVWAPGVLDRLARSGEAVLIPVETYCRWYEAKVPERQRQELEKRWGPPPGRFLVWERDGEKFIVLPRIELGNVILLPQPLRGEAHDTSLVHDNLVPPPHNYLATYFWLQEEFQADAVVHFGTHGTEFLLPGRPMGLGPDDWPDIIMGRMPNINPWVVNNLGESSPVRRRAYAVLVDHLVPPSVNAELSDELLNLHNDIDKWVALDAGALKEKFRASITAQVRETHLDKDLGLDLTGGRSLSSEQIMRVIEYLHDIHNETTPTSLHVFGEPPRDDLLIPYLVTCLRKPFLDALGEVIDVPPEEALNPGDRDKYLRKKAEEVVTLLVRREFEPAEALVAVGAKLPKSGISKALQESFDLAMQLNEGFNQTHQELDNLMAALDGRFITPGPSNSPDRNPAVLPTGRNMYVMNPEEVPSRPSWELGVNLIDRFLAEQHKKKGRYPNKVAFTLNSFATFQDYGVMESQILYLMGVRPVWDARNLVVDVELIPQEELGRPRIDVFISAFGYYRDMLPTRLHLLDKAVRLVAGVQEEGNLVFRNSVRVREALKAAGVPPERASKLASARIFGQPPGQIGGPAGYYYLVEKSGDWDSREELIGIYLEHAKYVYTEGLWGDKAAEALDRQIQGAEVVLRTWADRTRSPLSNKYVWYKGGSLSLAIKTLTGVEPEFYLSDVRDPDRARMVAAENALRQDYRVRLFNRKWIEGMMKEGYAGADQIAVHVANTMGWKIMRENSVSDDIWEEILDIYLHDSLNLNIREWFDRENPYAYQEMTEILLESIRKGYWTPNEQTVREIAVEYAQSVARHGDSGGLRGGDNFKLQAFVEKILEDSNDRHLSQLLEQLQRHYENRDVAAKTPDSAIQESPITHNEESSAGDSETRSRAAISTLTNGSTKVHGKVLTPLADETSSPQSTEVSLSGFPWKLIVLLLCILFICIGYARRWGSSS
ncbi:MAG: cobaltochelatase subunit CobN [Planctomycetota bacterium]|nr:MAG: cobaltochelatase subunit CobN [Planctomycetota bacterium]